MRLSTGLLVLPLLVGFPLRAALAGHGQAVPASRAAAADSTAVAVRWNRLVPRFVDQAAAARRAARAAAAVSGDSVALRRIAMTPPPILFRVYTLLSVAQYAAVNAARDDAGVASQAAVAGASAAALAAVFTDSTVCASIARELDNIVAFHVFLEPSGLPVAAVVAALEIYLARQHRGAYLPMRAARAYRGSSTPPPSAM